MANLNIVLIKFQFINKIWKISCFLKILVNANGGSVHFLPVILFPGALWTSSIAFYFLLATYLKLSMHIFLQLSHLLVILTLKTVFGILSSVQPFLAHYFKCLFTSCLFAALIVVYLYRIVFLELSCFISYFKFIKNSPSFCDIAQN